MRIKSAILIAAIAISVAICIYALVIPESADFKLALAAFSACIASYSAWQFRWRTPDVEPIGGIYPEGTDRKQGMLFFFNDGAYSTLLRILGAESEQDDSRQYEFTRAMHPIASHDAASIKMTLVSGEPLVNDRVRIKYVFCKGVKIVERTAYVTWEGTNHGNKT